MKIAEASLSLHTGHRHQIRREHLESIRFEQAPSRGTTAGADRISISPAAHHALSAAASAPGKLTPLPEDDALNADASSDPRFGLLASLIEFLTGHPVVVFSAGHLTRAARQNTTDPPPVAPETGRLTVTIERREIREEVETTGFRAEGRVRRDDGTSFRFDMTLVLARREYQESRETLRIGNAARKDPLTINFTGTSTPLLAERTRLDLDSNGTAEDIPLLAAGLAYLTLDRNGNGRIDSGLELFGPKTDEGFAELATLDDDGNGWIDEADPAFVRLSLWRPSASPGTPLQSLASAGIGALGLAHAGTPFELRGAGGLSLGGVRATGVAILESGLALPMHEIDLDVA